MPRIQIPRKLQRILTTEARIIVIIGGRGSAKSESVARLMILKAQTEQADILCGREYQNSIDDSVHKLLAGLIEQLKVPGAYVTDKKINFAGGGGFRYKGFARNSSAVKSAQGFKYSWVEEAQDLSEDSIRDLLPTIRAGESKLFFTANPKASTDPFSKRFIAPFQAELDKHGYYEDDMHLVIVINWRDNPWHGELEKQRLWDKEHMSRAEYDHVWEGAYSDEVPGSIILPEWFDAAVDAHEKLGIKPKGLTIVSHDPADGGDEKGLVIRCGILIKQALSDQIGDVNEGCDWATDTAIDERADVFTYDEGGLGLSLKRQIADALKGRKIDIIPFNGASKPENPNAIYQPCDAIDKFKGRKNKDAFRNRRAQYYWRLRDKFYNTYRAVQGDYMDPDSLIAISSECRDLTKFRSELCRIPRKDNPSGLIQIMSKQEMKDKLHIASPNIADSAMMGEHIPAITKRTDSRPSPRQARSWMA